MSELVPACAGLTELFYSDRRDDRRKAALVCSRCPLLDACRERVLTCANLEYGVWAGMTEGERDRARAARREQERADAASGYAAYCKGWCWSCATGDHAGCRRRRCSCDRCSAVAA